MNAHHHQLPRPVSLAHIADVPAFLALRRAAAAGQSPREQAVRLRKALYWARLTQPEWSQACDGLNFDLVAPSFAPARLEMNLANGGVVLVRIEGPDLVFLRIDPRRSTRMQVALPQSLKT